MSLGYNRLKRECPTVFRVTHADDIPGDTSLSKVGDIIRQRLVDAGFREIRATESIHDSLIEAELFLQDKEL